MRARRQLGGRVRLGPRQARHLGAVGKEDGLKLHTPDFGARRPEGRRVLLSGHAHEPEGQVVCGAGGHGGGRWSRRAATHPLAGACGTCRTQRPHSGRGGGAGAESTGRRGARATRREGPWTASCPTQRECPRLRGTAAAVSAALCPAGAGAGAGGRHRTHNGDAVVEPRAHETHGPRVATRALSLQGYRPRLGGEVESVSPPQLAGLSLAPGIQLSVGCGAVGEGRAGECSATGGGRAATTCLCVPPRAGTRQQCRRRCAPAAPPPPAAHRGSWSPQCVAPRPVGRTDCCPGRPRGQRLRQGRGGG